MSHSRQRYSVQRLLAVLIKETIQMRRDRLTFAMILGIPLMQLVLFGFAINMDPRHLPTAVISADSSPFVRAMLHSMRQSGYFEFVTVTKSESEFKSQVDPDPVALLTRGEVAFVLTVPSGFTRQLLRGEQPQLLLQADATDPAAAANAVANLAPIIRQAVNQQLQGTLAPLQSGPDPFELIIHRHFNPAGVTQYNIVPGLLGVILTMTMVMITSVAMTRETERGTMENLLALPVRPLEVMIGKIIPYVLLGLLQAAIIIGVGAYVFAVPFLGAPGLLLAGIGVFILANLALGFLFSTLVRTQMQAMQLTFFFFLPSMLLSGFMFPFRGMPVWAQSLGELLPLTHFLRVVRGVMLKAAQFQQLWPEFLALGLFLLAIGGLALLRYRRTLD